MLKRILQHIIDWIFFLIPYPRPTKSQLDELKIVAHRGWHDNHEIFENTMEAFDMAVAARLYGIEFDIRWTKDLVPVVHHDPTLLRLFRKDKWINQMNFSELRQQFPEVPALAEVVQRFGKKIHFFIEIKDEVYPNLIKQKEFLRQILGPLKVGEDFHFICLFEEPLEKFNLFAKEHSLLVAQFNISEYAQLVESKGWGGLTGHYLLLTNKMLAKQKQMKKLTGTGFPKSSNCLKREIHRGVDFVFTNHPWKLISSVKTWE